MSHIVHGERHGNVEHLPGEHVDVGGHDALCDGLIQHAHVEGVMRVQSTLGLARGAAGVENQHGVIARDLCRRGRFRIRGGFDQLFVVTVCRSAEHQCLGDAG